jgi:SAM-dependent methyltransferase
MTYADYTFKDKNKIKSWLQKQRLATALGLIEKHRLNVQRMLDFGAGDGELCKQFAQIQNLASIICYEPTPSLLHEARKNLASLNSERVIFLEKLTSDIENTLDVVYCLEVFEHLPPQETRQAIRSIQKLLHPNGHAIIGVPVEIGIPALYKGLFRMFRRYGRFDASFKNVSLSVLGFPPAERPLGEISPGFHFYFEHLGFNWKTLRSIFEKEFVILDIVSSPFNLGAWCMPEVYFVLKKK